MDNNRFRWEVRPTALEENIVVGKKYRFTVLTPSLIRMEFDENGEFEDRATQVVFYRDFAVNKFESRVENGVLSIETENLLITYKENAEFSADNLSVKLKCEPASSWKFGEKFEDLGGTVKTLDTINGALPMGHGVCSRNGFAIIDDSNSLALGEDGWIETRNGEKYDVYFFGYGFDYSGAVTDLYKLTGAPSMLPAYALGNWWSRYHAYTQQEYIDLMERFKEEKVPFSVGVIDMDWHIVNIPKEQQDPELPGGWTGYSWNKELFPDYKAFLKYLHDNNIHTSLNLHPADGIRRHEDMYEEMARACGIDPATGERVKLDILSKDFMAKYFDIVHHPYEADGVDFWWMDWQQGRDYWWIHEPNRDGNLKDEREKVDPLWMLNHLHIIDIGRDGKRPMFFSRFAGPGSHRYPVGFSGDTHCTWESLDFQPQFTNTASNIGYSWWSHDIGGHQRGYRSSDLLVRWMQYGIFSPINRIHSSNNPFQQKEPWFYDMETASVMKDTLRLRHAMFPYIYTMNYRNHKDLKPLTSPMYYKYPKCSAAYEIKNQYFFGTELMVAPITEDRDKKSHLSHTKVWLPEGEWFDFFDGTRYSGCGGRIMDIYRPIDKYPVFAKSGAIVPMANFKDNLLCNSDDMSIAVFPCADNSFTLYEDAGEGNEYKNGAFATTEMNTVWNDKKAVFTVKAAKGDLSLIPQKRLWNISFRGFDKDTAVSVSVAGKACECTAVYDKKTHSLNASVSALVTEDVVFTVTGDNLVYNNDDVKDDILNIIITSDLDLETKNKFNHQVNKEGITIHRKIYDMTGFALEAQPTVNALAEKLTLTEPEFDDGDVFSC